MKFIMQRNVPHSRKKEYLQRGGQWLPTREKVVTWSSRAACSLFIPNQILRDPYKTYKVVPL